MIWLSYYFWPEYGGLGLRQQLRRYGKSVRKCLIHLPSCPEGEANEFPSPSGEKGVKGLQSRQDNHYTMLLISAILEITISKTTLFSFLTNQTLWNLCAILLCMTYVT